MRRFSGGIYQEALFIECIVEASQNATCFVQQSECYYSSISVDIEE